MMTASTPLRLTSAAVSSLPMRALPWGNASMGRTSMPAKSRSSSVLERQHTEGLPLLVAHEADALALESIESRGVRLPRLEPARRFMELERHHDVLLL
jgi:hypothetical protein